MKLSLVTAAIATDFEHPDDAASASVRTFSTAPQLGTLSLAAVAEANGVRPCLINLDRLYYNYLAEFGARGLGDFPDWVSPRIAASQADIYGFSSICSSYPLTLRIVARLKQELPESTILLGGPQASVVDLATLHAFPFVDAILRGECEQTLPRFLEEWSGGRRFDTVPGLAFRSPFGPTRTPDAPVIDDLDALPMPAYHLTGELTGAPYAMLELGRGCPFACTFCSTNDFFRRKFRVKSPARMLAEMRTIARQYAIRRFDLVHDMFTVDRRRVADFCRHLIESGDKLQWCCSARTDCVDDELLDLMAAAGCVSIFFGIESGSKRMQRIFEKDLDPDRARLVIGRAERLGIATTVSLIAGFPEETRDDLRDSVAMYMHSLRHAHSSPQLNLLAPLAGTPIHTRHRHEMFLDELCSDMSHQGRTQNEADRELIGRYPDIFPNFYSLPAPGLDRALCLELREFVRAAALRLRWILVALNSSVAGAGALDFFTCWREHRLQLHPALTGGELRHYYTRKLFADEFVDFAARTAGGDDASALHLLLTAYRKLRRAEDRDARLPRPLPANRMTRAALPVRAPQVHVIELACDIQEVIDALKRGEAPPPRRTRRFYRSEQTPEGSARLVRITPLVGRALQLCDGSRTVAQFVQALSRRFPGDATYLLKALQSNGFIAIYRSASHASRDASKLRYQRGTVKASGQT